MAHEKPATSVYIHKCYIFNGSVITIYNSHKCVVQGKDADFIMQTFFSEYYNQSQKSTKEAPAYSNVKNKTIHSVNKYINNETALFEEYQYEVGSDEVGVGDYFGGLVVCACLVKHSDLNKLKDLGVNDSKKLTDTKILEIAPKLMKIVQYDVKEIHPAMYNQLFNQLQNTHVIKTFMHNEALASLLKSVSREDCYVILDEYASRTNYEKYLRQLHRKTEIKIDLFLTKAESYFLSVAAGSIIARYVFLKQIEYLSQQLNYPVPLGAWNEKVKATAIYVKEHLGSSALNQYVKLHFKNTGKF
ncbi:hypothetical protein UREOM_6730 [Ureaplasma sp. OM1]|uniref:Ribonuclease n=2 Tax=Ureaplasma ceti TaxID=3119530 RepID=A0ABP9UA48_9BACT